MNLTRTVLHGVTRNPWQLDRTPGGSSGGSAAAVAGGLVTLATGGDGGGSIRIPAGFSGLVGLKATSAASPARPRRVRQPDRHRRLPLTLGARHARWFDVCNGYDSRDPLSLPRVEGWEAGLGTHLDELRGRRVAVVPDWGGATCRRRCGSCSTAADGADRRRGLMVRVDGVDTGLPRMGGRGRSAA